MPLQSLQPLQPPAAPSVHLLHPGDVACDDRGARFETLLGSCVAIILTDPRRTVGVMCHIVHPGPPACRSSREGRTGAFADVALDIMYAQLNARGIVPRMCDAYVYGGANMFPGMAPELRVGDRNVHWVLQALADDHVRVLAQDVGGHRYRKLAWVVGPQSPQLTVAGQ